MSENKPCVVQAAAKVAFASSAVKQRAANQLILASKSGKYTLDTVQLALETVAQAAWLQPKDLLKQLKADPCFKVVQTAGAGSPSGYFVGLNILKIMSVAMNTTSTGMLTEELPPPKGFVDGKHPIRPGQPDCKHFVRFGECAYNERCVFNHPGKPSGDQQSAGAASVLQNSDSNSSSYAPARALVPAPPPKVPAWGGAGVHAASTKQAPGGHEPPSTNSSASAQQGSNAGVSSEAVGSSQDTAAGTAHDTDNVPDQVLQAQQQPMPAWLHQQAQHVAHPSAQQEPVQSAPEAAHAATKLPPGFAPVHYKGRPCTLLMLRGFCPMGDKCPYDHPLRAGAGSRPGAAGSALQGVPPISTADSGVAPLVVSPLAADAQPGTPDGMHAVSAQSTAAVRQAAAGAQPAGQAAREAATMALAAPPQRSWRELLGGPSQYKQQQQLQRHAQHQERQSVAAAAAQADDEAVAANLDYVCPDKADRLMGWTEGNLPQLRGEPNCPFYMGTGMCKFKERCLYHHPASAEHPECVVRGDMPKRYNVNNHPSYGRLVNYLYRIWDYDSCAEAQLKIWLAKHILARNNPKHHMFDSSAKKPAVGAHGKGFYWQPLGPYTCSLGEAGEVLHHMWRAQPDAAAHEPMPYTKMLRELLTGDPYYELVVDQQCSSHYWVKLNIEKIKSMLNF